MTESFYTPWSDAAVRQQFASVAAVAARMCRQLGRFLEDGTFVEDAAGQQVCKFTANDPSGLPR